MSSLYNRVRVSTATTGTGTITLGGATSNAFFTFAEAGVADATVVSYVIEDGTDVEFGIGTYTVSGTTLSRDTVTASKIGGTAGTSKINLSGTAIVFIDSLAGDLPHVGTPTEAAPAAGDFVPLMGAEGDMRKVNWNNLPGAAGATPGGADGDVQFKNAAAFAGDSDLNWDSGTNQLKLGGSIGGEYKISMTGSDGGGTSRKIGCRNTNTGGYAVIGVLNDSDREVQVIAGGTAVGGALQNNGGIIATVDLDDLILSARKATGRIRLFTGADPETTEKMTIASAGHWLPGTDDQTQIGSTTLRIADIFLAEGGVINWDNGDLTMTQTGNSLALAGGTLTGASVDAATDTTTGVVEIATQAEQETGTDTTRAVTPGRQHFHPSAAKFWVYWTANSTTILKSYNTTSIADTAVGDADITIGTDFSDANWAGFVNTNDASAAWDAANTQSSGFNARAAGTAGVLCSTITDGTTAVASLTDPDQWQVVGFGDL